MIVTRMHCEYVEMKKNLTRLLVRANRGKTRVARTKCITMRIETNHFDKIKQSTVKKAYNVLSENKTYVQITVRTQNEPFLNIRIVAADYKLQEFVT